MTDDAWRARAPALGPAADEPQPGPVNATTTAPEPADTQVRDRNGRFVPCAYADTAAPLREEEALGWLDARMRSERNHYREALLHARQFHALFASWKHADPADANRPRFDQDWFSGLDAAMAYAMVRRLRPQRIVEVGSGHSTRFMARAIRDGALPTDLHSIDPQPRRAIDRVCSTITRDSLTRVPLQRFDALGPNDILFVDGSHVLLPGNDVDHLFTRILPRLAAGVVVHLHDIFLPWGYPAAWQRRTYTEQSLLAAVLSGGSRFRILAPHAWLRRNETEAVDALQAYLAPGAREAGFWLQVTAPAD